MGAPQAPSAPGNSGNWLDGLLASLPASSSQTTAIGPSVGPGYDPAQASVPMLARVYGTQMDPSAQAPVGAQPQSQAPASQPQSQPGLSPQLAALAAPPSTLAQPSQQNATPQAQQQVQGAQAQAQHGGPGNFFGDLFHGLFSSNPGYQGAEKAPGIMGLLPAGSGIQNILGSVWDTALMSEGLPAQYNQWKQQVQTGQLEKGLTAQGYMNPDGTINPSLYDTASKLSAMGQPDKAQALISAASEMMGRRIEMQKNAAEIGKTVSDTNSTNQKTQIGRLGQMAGFLSTATSDPDYQAKLNYVKGQLSPEDFTQLGAPTAYSPDGIKGMLTAREKANQAIATTYITPEQQVQNTTRAVSAQGAADRGKAALITAGQQSPRTGIEATNSGTESARQAEQARHDKAMEDIARNKKGGHTFGGAPAAPASTAPSGTPVTATHASTPPPPGKNGPKVLYGSDGSRVAWNGSQWVHQ